MSPRRARWTDPRKKLFIDLCLQEANNGGRWKGSLKPSSWNKVIQELKRLTGKDYSQKQLKNSYDYMKKHYVIWTKLVIAMGGGFDASTDKVDWPAERCDQYFEKHKDARQFRHKPLQFAVELAALFDEIIELESTSSQPHEEGEPSNYDRLLLQPSKDLLPDGENDLDSQTSMPSNPMSTATPTSALNAGSDAEAPARNKRRRKENREDVAELMKDKKEKKEDTAELIKGILAFIAKDSDTDTVPTIKECVNSLSEMSTLTKTDELYYAALTAFCDKKEYRELWMCMTDEDVRIAWLRSILPRLGLSKSS